MKTKELKNLPDNKDLLKRYNCCQNQRLETGVEKYPLGLPLDRLKITYCENCHQIHNVE